MTKGVGGGGVSGGVVPGATIGVVAANNNMISTAAVTFADNTTSRIPHVASPQGDISNIRTLDFGGYLSTSTGLASATNYTFKRFIEYPDGVFHAVKWAGVSSSPTLGAFNTIESDIVISSTSGLPLIIPAGALFWERTVKLTGGAVAIPTRTLPAASSTIGNGAGKSLSDLGNSGTIAADASINHFGSACIKGDVALSSGRSFLLIGDSLVFGQGDVTSVGANRDSGWLARGVGPNWPYLKIALGGISEQTLSAVVNGAAMTTFLSRLALTDVVDEGGLNDLSLNSRSKAQLLADKQAVWNKFGGTRVWVTTLTARTDSSNGWADAAGQTPKTDGTYPLAPSVNADLRAKPAPVFGVLDAADFDMTARDSGIHGGPFPPVSDATHFVSAKCASMGALANSALAL